MTRLARPGIRKNLGIGAGGEVQEEGVAILYGRHKCLISLSGKDLISL